MHPVDAQPGWYKPKADQQSQALSMLDRLVAPLGLTSARWQILGAIVQADRSQPVAWLARDLGAALGDPFQAARHVRVVEDLARPLQPPVGAEIDALPGFAEAELVLHVHLAVAAMVDGPVMVDIGPDHHAAPGLGDGGGHHRLQRHGAEARQGGGNTGVTVALAAIDTIATIQAEGSDAHNRDSPSPELGSEQT